MATESSLHEGGDFLAVDALDSGKSSAGLPAHRPTPDDKTVISKRPPLPLDVAPYAASLQTFGSALIGRRLEHYELNEFVGGGGMGAVFRANDTRLGRTVAVKVLSRDQNDEETIRRFRNEAQSAARLDHPNIARVYYVGEDQGLNFIVFEFIAGINLRDEIERNGALALEQALLYTLQVAEALAHSSSRDVIHRDIKPSNVLVMENGQVKLVDMGLARIHQVEPSDDLTASGVTLGTFDYISPEQARDPRVADVRSDIYSLGCTLYFMLAGQPPFPEGTALQKLLRHNSDEPPDVRRTRPELSPRIAALLARILAKRPSQRPQSAAELIAEIVSLGRHLGLTSVAKFGSAAITLETPSNKWRDAAWQVIAAVGLLVALIVGAELALSPQRATLGMVMQPRFKPMESKLPGTILPASNQDNDRKKAPVIPPSAHGATSSKNAVPRTAARVTIEPPIGTLPLEGSGSGSRLPNDSLDASTTAAAQAANTIVVLGDVPAPPEPLTEYVSSLAEACIRAAELGLNEVHLGFNGPKVEQPLEINNPRIDVRAGEGFRPVVVFRPQVRDLERQMIKLAGGSSVHTGFHGVEVRMELPADLPADGWALFGMSTGQSLDLTDCVLTVQDGDEDQLPIHDQVSMISVQRRRPNEAITLADMQLAMGQQARIGLNRTIARGEANLVGMVDETPLTIRWTQGLLVTSRHLIETGGSAAEPQYYEQIVIDLDHVTAYCRQGLYYLRRGPSKGHQFYVSANADRCVFSTDPSVALFEMCGLAAPPEEDELQSMGEGNRFSPAEMPFLFVRPSIGGEPQAFRLGRRWSSETRSQAGVPWVRPPTVQRPAHTAAKSDFLIDTDATSGEAAGFDPQQLPECGTVAGMEQPAANS